MKAALMPYDSVWIASRLLAVRQPWRCGRARRPASRAGGLGVISATRLWSRRWRRDGQARLV